MNEKKVSEFELHQAWSEMFLYTVDKLKQRYENLLYTKTKEEILDDILMHAMHIRVWNTRGYLMSAETNTQKLDSKLEEANEKIRKLAMELEDLKKKQPEESQTEEEESQGLETESQTQEVFPE